MAKVAILGMGAVGAVYGRRLFQHYGEDFVVIAKGERRRKLQSRGFTLNGVTYHPRVIDPSQSRETVELLIPCVKNYRLSEAIRDALPVLQRSKGVPAGKDQGSLVLPLLNGITAREAILSVAPSLHVFYGLCVKIDAVNTINGVINSQEGIIRFGERRNDPPTAEVLRVKEWLAEADIQVEVPVDMERMVWKKWMMNVGINQITALTGATYGQAMMTKEGRHVLRQAMEEVIALAAAEKISLTKEDLEETMTLFETFSPQGKTSMLQDMENGGVTEADSFAGTVVKLGKKHQLATPVNEMLYCLLKAKESVLVK